MGTTCTGPGPCVTTPFGAGKNWVNKVGGLPDYIRAVAHALVRSGHSESTAIATAIATVKTWAAGGGNVSAATRARAAKAVAEWEAKKAAAHSLTAAPAATVDLAEPGRVYHFKHGWIPLDHSAATGDLKHKMTVTPQTNALGKVMFHRVHVNSVHAGHVTPDGTSFRAVRKTADAQDGRLTASGFPSVDKAAEWVARGKVDPARPVAMTAAPASAVDLASFTESLHPRVPAGKSGGGRFSAKSGGEDAVSGGPKTMRQQTRDFQRRTGLAVTGKYDSATRSKIHSLLHPTSGGSSGGSSGGTSKKAAAKAAAAAKKSARHTRAAQLINALPPQQRRQWRRQHPAPPAGYTWTATGTLRATGGHPVHNALATLRAHLL